MIWLLKQQMRISRKRFLWFWLPWLHQSLISMTKDTISVSRLVESVSVERERLWARRWNHCHFHQRSENERWEIPCLKQHSVCELTQSLDHLLSYNRWLNSFPNPSVTYIWFALLEETVWQTTSAWSWMQWFMFVLDFKLDQNYVQY